MSVKVHWQKAWRGMGIQRLKLRGMLKSILGKKIKLILP